MHGHLEGHAVKLNPEGYIIGDAPVIIGDAKLTWFCQNMLSSSISSSVLSLKKDVF